jgi:tetratricopeptide (TPR) repeat protein
MKTPLLLAFTSLCLGSAMPLVAQQPGTKPGYSQGMPYPDSTYRDDRRGTGPHFREIREVRRERGIEAGIAMLRPSFADYRKGLHSGWTDRMAFDEWGFWAWHEAQFDSGKNDPEWSAALYRWIFDEARRIGRMDWVFHASGNVLNASSTASRWGEYRRLLGEMTAYLEQQGFQVDPRRLPDRGQWDVDVPDVRTREFPVKVPNSRHVVYWQRHEQKDPSKPTWMDKGTANHMLHVAREHRVQGDWRTSIEFGLWVCSVVDAIGEFNRGKPGNQRVKREEEQLYLDAVREIANALQLLGLREAEERLVSRAMEKQLASQWEGQVWRNRLRERLLALRIEKGEASDAVLAELDALISPKDGRREESELGVAGARLEKAKCLMAMGRKSEALALLDELRKLTARKYANWLAVEVTHVDWCLDRGDLAEAGGLLPGLLEQVRKDGLKISEIPLYERYVRWAELSGDPGLAVLCQRELLRLLEGFSITPRLPVAQATLARLLASIGEKNESAARIATALALADKPHLPRRIGDSVRGIAAKLAGTAGGDVRKGRVLLQPGTAQSEAAAGFPARLMLQVVNAGEGRASGMLRISGVDCDLKWDRESRLGSVECRTGTGRREIAMEVEAQSMALFQCAANAVPAEGLALKAEWIEDGKTLETAEWTVKPADTVSTRAVIDAGLYRTDGFCMIPVYHHLQSREPGPANLRVVASVPCRVELYDEAGQLRMVDATGNGSCLDGGDWLREDADGNGAVELTPAADTGETNFHLFVDPDDAIPAEGIALKIEWLVDGQWHPASEDRITGD